MCERRTTQTRGRWKGLILLACVVPTFAAESSSPVPVDNPIKQETTNLVLATAETSFLREAANISLFGAELARIAEAGTGSAEMQILGMELRSEHARSLAALRELARQKGIALEPELSVHDAAVRTVLAALRGSKFDEAYREQALRNHERAIRLFAGAAAATHDLDLRMFAERSLGDMKERFAALGGKSVRWEGKFADGLPKPAKSIDPAKAGKTKKPAKPRPLDPAIAWAYRQPAPPPSLPAKVRPVDPRSLWRMPASAAPDFRPSPTASSAGTVPAPAPRLVPRAGDLSGRVASQPTIIVRQAPERRTFRIFSRDY